MLDTSLEFFGAKRKTSAAVSGTLNSCVSRAFEKKRSKFEAFFKRKNEQLKIQELFHMSFTNGHANPQTSTMQRGITYPLVFVGSYSTFSNLAHKPKGSPSPYTLHVFRLDPNNYSLTLLHTSNFDQNLAFLRYSPKHNVLYTVSESIVETDRGIFKVCTELKFLVSALSVLPVTGEVALLKQQSTEGKSACYITIDKECKNMLYVEILVGT